MRSVTFRPRLAAGVAFSMHERATETTSGSSTVTIYGDVTMYKKVLCHSPIGSYKSLAYCDGLGVARMDAGVRKMDWS